MVIDFPNRVPRVRILFREQEPVDLASVSALFYDLVLVHDRLLVLLSDQYTDAGRGYYFYTRRGRQIPKEHRLKVPFITKASPLSIVIDIPAALEYAALAWTLIQIVKTLASWNHDAEMRQLDKVARKQQILIQEEQLREIVTKGIESRASGHTQVTDEEVALLVRDIQRLAQNDQIRFNDVYVLDDREGLDGNRRPAG